MVLRFARRIIDIIELKLSTQRAMLGSVTANLAALTIGVSGTEIQVAATFFVDPTEDDRQEVECIATEIIANIHRIRLPLVNEHPVTRSSSPIIHKVRRVSPRSPTCAKVQNFESSKV